MRKRPNRTRAGAAPTNFPSGYTPVLHPISVVEQARGAFQKRTSQRPDKVACLRHVWTLQQSCGHRGVSAKGAIAKVVASPLTSSAQSRAAAGQRPAESMLLSGPHQVVQVPLAPAIDARH